MVIKKKVIPDIPTNTGICIDCVDRNDCPMVEMLQAHYTMADRHGTYDYRYIQPSDWEEFSVDDPILANSNSEVEWCPMYTNEVDHEFTLA